MTSSITTELSGWYFFWSILPLLALGLPASAAEVVRVGIVGCDTSHAPAFTEIINGENKQKTVKQYKVVAVFPSSSPDVERSRSRVVGFTEDLRALGVTVVDSMESLLEIVDVVILGNVDGRKHLPHAREIFPTGIPVFIDKPMGGTLAETLEIARLATETKTPCYSGSALRFSSEVTEAFTDETLGDIVGCSIYGPCYLEPHHPDLFWYGIHGVEMLVAVMGTGCREVSRVQTDDGEFVVGVWQDGRIGTFRGIREARYEFGGIVFGKIQNRPFQVSAGDSNDHLIEKVLNFFESHESPIPMDETIEIFAIMEAADESKRRGGKPVTLESVLKAAQW